MLSELRESGFHVTLDGEDIVVSPAYKLTPEQRELIREHKAEIIAELAQQTAHVTPDLIII
jgi:TubC N-terminal docking domain